MKTLKIFALISFIIMCLTVTLTNISTPVKAEPHITQFMPQTIQYETKNINGHVICVVKYGDEIAVTSW